MPLIDPIQVLDDLNKWGYSDWKIELCCGFSQSYVAQVRYGHVKEMSHNRAVRLYNFWLDEYLAQEALLPIHIQVTT
jgi:hypothetical protein